MSRNDNVHGQEGKMPVVARYVDMDGKWYLCHAASYQNAFRSEVNGFAIRAEAVRFAEQAGCAVEHHEYDPLQAINADGKVPRPVADNQSDARLFAAVGGQRYIANGYGTEHGAPDVPVQVDVLGDSVEFTVPGSFMLDLDLVRGLRSILDNVISMAERDAARG